MDGGSLTRKPWEAHQEEWKVAKRMRQSRARVPGGLKGTEGIGQTPMCGAWQLTLTTPALRYRGRRMKGLRPA